MRLFLRPIPKTLKPREVPLDDALPLLFLVLAGLVGFSELLGV